MKFVVRNNSIIIIIMQTHTQTHARSQRHADFFSSDPLFLHLFQLQTGISPQSQTAATTNHKLTIEQKKEVDRIKKSKTHNKKKIKRNWIIEKKRFFGERGREKNPQYNFLMIVPINILFSLIY